MFVSNRSTIRLAAALLLASACSDAKGTGGSFGTGTDGSTSSTGSTSGSTGNTTSGGTSTGGSTTGTKIDVSFYDDVGIPPGGSCDSVDPMGDAPGACKNQAPPDSFSPVIEWSWGGHAVFNHVLSTPLVINLTDDDDDGEINGCDTPDIVVLAYDGTLGGGVQTEGRLFVFDGATGGLHFMTDTPVSWLSDVATGDIDGDGLPELLASDLDGNMHAFEHDGTPVAGWTLTVVQGATWDSTAIADLDHDGNPEIVSGKTVLDNTGKLIEHLPDATPSGVSATAIADLDEDGNTEVVMGRSAFTYMAGSFTAYYEHPELEPGFAQVAELAGGGAPEILLLNRDGITVMDNLGNILVSNETPLNVDTSNPLNWTRPAAVHDFDGDGTANFALSARDEYAVMNFDGNTISVLDSWPVLDASGSASGTAFDFLGDGVAEAIYADENNLFVFELGNPTPLLEVPRTSRTGVEYPVVADVDNDGSAEIVVVSNENTDGVTNSLPLQVVGEAEDRWVQARRVWNQHTYHVTNVHEDGTIPANEVPSWEHLNTYRTNSQIEGGVVCVPEG